MSTTTIIHGLYCDENSMLNGVKSLVKKGIKINEVYTPFPVHELSKELNLSKTKISSITFLYGIFGFTFASILSWFIMIYDWPQNIGGKPNSSWYLNLPSFIPVIFELTIFFSAHLMVINFLIQNKIFPGSKRKNLDLRTTDDKFLIEIYSNDIDNIKNILISTGVDEITLRTK